ncbi:hypothetical protein FQZ99_15330 [Escherichia coli]|nr:hypothetical protein [Escherichia coli]
MTRDVGASRNIQSCMDAVVSRKTDSFNHPRTEERLWGVIYNTGMIHYQPCQEIQISTSNAPFHYCKKTALVP